MKVAAVTNNHATVSQHYGKARCFVAFTVRDSEVVARDVRRIPGSLTSAALGAAGRGPGADHGRESAAIVADCGALIAGGMGRGPMRISSEWGACADGRARY